ncbi:12326_t:CDS:1, partial [Racocetra persica]
KMMTPTKQRDITNHDDSSKGQPQQTTNSETAISTKPDKR